MSEMIHSLRDPEPEPFNFVLLRAQGKLRANVATKDPNDEANKSIISGTLLCGVYPE